jgi:acyl-coenzyme A thioesterase PaaI-like protein
LGRGAILAGVNLGDYLEAERASDSSWRFTFTPDMHGAFGGVFGGLVAAACVWAGRSLEPQRTPAALDCRFLRGLPAGTATVDAKLLHSGRSLACVATVVHDERGRLATDATLTLIDASALHPLTRAHTAPSFDAFDDADPWPPVAPIVTTLGARTVGRIDGAIATAVRVPWDEESSAEAVCLAADMCVGPPVAFGVSRERVAHPNPDLSVRFCGRARDRVVVGLGRMVRAHGGVAAVAIEVFSGGDLCAAGVSSSLLVPL